MANQRAADSSSGSPPSFHDLISQLVLAHRGLVAARDAFVASVQSERNLPAWSPGQDTPDLARTAVATEWGRLLRLPDQEEHLPAGVVCASSATMAMAEAFNTQKTVFAETVKALKVSLNTEKRSFDQVIRAATYKTGQLADDWWTVLSRAGLNQFDLRHVYAPVCCQPGNLESLSFTWSARHRMVYRVNADEALAMARLCPDDVKARVQPALGRFGAQDFARISGERVVRRVNAVYRNKDSLTRTTLAPTLLLIGGPRLPHIVWREAPAGLPRLSRRDRTLSAEPVIPELGLHVYLQ